MSDYINIDIPIPADSEGYVLTVQYKDKIKYRVKLKGASLGCSFKFIK